MNERSVRLISDLFSRHYSEYIVMTTEKNAHPCLLAPSERDSASSKIPYILSIMHCCEAARGRGGLGGLLTPNLAQNPQLVPQDSAGASNQGVRTRIRCTPDVSLA